MPVRGEVREPLGGSSPLVMEMAGIAAGCGGVVERVDALLDRLRQVFPCDASFVALLHPDRREHLYLVRNGYDDRACAYLDSAEFRTDVELCGGRPTRPPGRLWDLPGPPDEVEAWVEYLAPAGFRDGIGVGLFTPDGRYLGVVCLYIVRAVPPTDAARDLIGALAPLMAHAVDPMRSVSAVAATVADAVAGVVVTPTGTALPLPGLPPHPLLTTGSGLVRVATGQLSGGSAHVAFLCRETAAADPDGSLRVTALSAPIEPPYYFAAVVTVGPPGDLHGLTRRELEVLGLLVEGWPNRAIALDLGITERTVAAHVEHILAKLDVTSRTVAAVSALRLGLFVPRLLRGGGDPQP